MTSPFGDPHAEGPRWAMTGGGPQALDSRNRHPDRSPTRVLPRDSAESAEQRTESFSSVDTAETDLAAQEPAESLFAVSGTSLTAALAAVIAADTAIQLLDLQRRDLRHGHVDIGEVRLLASGKVRLTAADGAAGSATDDTEGWARLVDGLAASCVDQWFAAVLWRSAVQARAVGHPSGLAMAVGKVLAAGAAIPGFADRSAVVGYVAKLQNTPRPEPTPERLSSEDPATVAMSRGGPRRVPRRQEATEVFHDRATRFDLTAPMRQAVPAFRARPPIAPGEITSAPSPVRGSGTGDPQAAVDRRRTVIRLCVNTLALIGTCAMVWLAWRSIVP